MARYIRGSGWKGSEMGKGSSIGRMGVSIPGHGKMTKLMGRESSYMLMEIYVLYYCVSFDYYFILTILNN